MDRDGVLEWLRTHPQLVHGDPEVVVSRCETAVRRHAREDAWMSAKRYAEERQHDWEAGHGAHASEAFVAKEVCGQLARDLAQHEATPQAGDEDHLAGGVVRAALESEGWELMIPWIMQVAREEEHRTWQEIVEYTKQRARELISSHHLSSDTRFDHTRCYGDVAAWVSGVLARDFSEHAFPRGGGA